MKNIENMSGGLNEWIIGFVNNEKVGEGWWFRVKIGIKWGWEWGWECGVGWVENGVRMGVVDEIG